MAAPDTDDSTSSHSSSPQAARPSWEAAPRPAAPRLAPTSRPAETSIAAPAAEALPASPYYASPKAAPPAYAPAASEVPAHDPDVRYDLAGNPIPSSGPAAAPPTLAAPFGYSAGTTAPGVWPPKPASPYGQPASENGTDRVAKLKWNWGAFFIPLWWSVFNGQKGIALAVFLLNCLNRVVPAPYDWGIVIASLGIQVYLGAMGHRLAWSSDRFGGDYDNFIRTQRAWMIWGFILAGLIIGALVTAAALLPGFANGLSGGSQSYQHHYRPYSNGDGSTGQ